MEIYLKVGVTDRRLGLSHNHVSNVCRSLAAFRQAFTMARKRSKEEVLVKYISEKYLFSFNKFVFFENMWVTDCFVKYCFAVRMNDVPECIDFNVMEALKYFLFLLRCTREHFYLQILLQYFPL